MEPEHRAVQPGGREIAEERRRPEGQDAPEIGEEPVPVVAGQRRHAHDPLTRAQLTACIAEVRRVPEG